MNLAEALLERLGGAGNVRLMTRCWVRLRFVLHDYGAVDQQALDAMPDVAMAVARHGQFQIALHGGLGDTFDHLAHLLIGGSGGRQV
jgi:PTS system beta-glucosides-specific IIC component